MEDHHRRLRPEPTVTLPKAIGITAGIAAASLLICGVAVVLPLLGAISASAACPAIPAAAASTPDAAGWTAIQRGHAAVIVAVGRQRGVHPRGWVIAVATAMQEGRL